MQYIADYYGTVQESYTHNAQKWGDNTDYANLVPQMQQWIKERHDYILNTLPVHDITDLIDNDTESAGYNWHNGIYTVYGERVANRENLQQGLYIINGKKVFIKR